MNSVMDCVQILSLCSLCKLELSFGCAILSLYTKLKVLLCACGYNFAKELSELGSVLCLFMSSLLIVQTDLRISLAECYTSHCQIHSNLGALTLEVSLQAFLDIFRNVSGNAYYMLGSPCALSSLIDLYKFGFRLFAGRALPVSRKILELNAFNLFIIDVSAYCTFPFSHLSYHLS